MKTQLVYLHDYHSLQLIHHHLKNLPQFLDNPYFDTYFQKLTQLNNNYQEPIFAIALHDSKPNHILIIYTLHTQYKFTRSLSKCLHIQQIFVSNEIGLQDIQLFHKEIIPQLDCYKVVALGIQQNSLLKPNQLFMTLQNKPML